MQQAQAIDFSNPSRYVVLGNHNSPAPRKRFKFNDGFMTFDGAYTTDANGNQLGKRLRGCYTADGRTVDSTGAFLVGELERLDMTLHDPLVDITWGRDIDLREDVTIADEVSSFTLSTYGSAGSLGGNSIRTGKAWIGKTTDQISGVDVNIAKLVGPLRPWALEIKYTILELESAARLGRPIDAQKYEALKMKHQMDVDEQVYTGDSTVGDTGLFNHSLGTNYTNATAGSLGSSLWSKKTPDEILTDVNELLTSVWAASAWATMPNRLLIPPLNYGTIGTQKVSTAGNVSVLTYLLENNIARRSGKPLEINYCKWAIGGGQSGTFGTDGAYNAMLAYVKEKDRVRFPMTLLQRTPVQYDSIYHKSTYFARLGRVELVYPETWGRRDGI